MREAYLAVPASLFTLHEQRNNKEGKMARIKVGDNFGDFTLSTQKDLALNTNDIKGKKILLSFHPLAWTPVCAQQMQSLESNYQDFQDCNTVPLGISVDSVPCKKAWAQSLGIANLDLLADFWPHGDLASRLGIFIEQFGMSERANIILNEQRVAIFVKVYPIKKLPDVQEVISFLKK
jgi:peroxiredoxin